MVKERRGTALPSGVCIGILLLLSNTVLADTVKDPAASLDKSFTVSGPKSSTFEGGNETRTNKIPSEEEAKATLPERGDGRAVDFRDRKNGYAADREIEEVENVAMPIGESSNLEEGIGAGEKNDDWLSTTAGSDVSSKLVSRIPNTGVTGTVTAKAFAEEAKLVERKNKTSEGVPLNETASSKEQESATIGSDNGVVVKLEEDREKNDSSPRQLHFLQEPRERKKAESRNAVKNLEILDLEKKSASEKKADDDGSTSLINDTYVNYSHLYRVSTVGSADTKRENESKALETSTSTEKSTVTSPESASTDPKNEVEVVGNVTHATILERQSENFSAKDSSPINEVIERPKTEGKKAEEIEKATSSPIPRGRTMAFAEVANEFSDLYVKPTIASNPRFSTFAKKNSTDKSYLHVKSAGKGQPDNASNEVLVTSEGGDASALENTIGRGRSEEKLIVTEASDVLENSIQQLIRPGYSEEASNESSSSPLTTISLSKLGEMASTHRTPIDRLPDSRERVAEPKEKSTIAGNNVSEWIEGQESTITGNDVTGNGITEASPKPRTDQLLQEIANKSSIPSVHATTTESMKLQTDVQINAEGSLLLRSTLNATETSTEYSLTKGNNSDVTFPPTVTSTAVERSSTENVTESGMEAGTEAESTSVTLRPEENFTATTTVTTTGIEFEFVGLTESVASSPRSGNESSTEAVSSGIDDSTISNEVVGPNLSTTLPTEETTVAATTLSVDDQTTARSSVIEEETDRTTPTGATDGEADSTVAIGVDLPRITTVEGDLATTNFVVTEQTLSSDPKDFPSTIATTDLPAIATTVDSYIPFDFEPTVPPPSPSVPADLPSTKSSDGKVVPQDHGEITSLVRIDVRGSWYDVCPHMDKLKVALASVLSNGTNRSVSDEQIILHQDPCQEPPGESSGTTTATSTPTDVPITSILLYVVDKTGKFDATMTESLPGWYEEFRERVSFPLQIHRFRLVQETIPDSGNAIAAIVVSSIAFVCLVLLAGLLFVMRKRQTRFNYGERCRPVSLDAYSLDSVSAYNSVRRKGVARSSKRSYGNPTFEDSSAIPSHPLNFAGLSSFCNDVHAIDAEFASIPQISPKIDELPAGAEVKNRFANVIPLPETRVPLQKINDDPLSEYINASYVRGPKNATRYYIACQAPMDSTVTDFWRMIWEQQCKVIVMLTDLAENGVEKCTEYIPPSEVMDCHRLYGDYQVTLKKRETKEKYAISMVQLKNLENNTFRDVYHIWYLWPVNGTQSDGAGLIAVLLEARALQRGGPGPIVVHCSPGTGRTGTLIALDLGIRQYEITRTVDVPRVVYTIRRDRAGAVQTKEQYAFIYKALNLYATKLAGGVLEST